VNGAFGAVGVIGGCKGVVENQAMFQIDFHL